MPRTQDLQTNFSAGEVSPGISMRQDAEQYKNGAKSLRNRRCLIGGGTKRRPGSALEAALPGPARLIEFIVNQTTQYVLAFGEARMDAYVRNITTGALTAAGSLTSMPWTLAIYPEMDWAHSGNTLFLVHEDMPPQIITRTGASTWTQEALTFYSGPASRPEQPYFKFAAADVTLTASDVTGSITLTTSADHFVEAHVGEYIRYNKKACLVTAFTDAQNVTATVVETLPETQDLTVTSSALFAVGEVVEGDSTGAKGLITSIPDSTSIVVVQIEKLIAFTTADDLVGPNAGATNISAVANTTNAAVTDWDEQMFGSVNGYPAAVELHRGRLVFAGHKSAPDYLMASTIGNLYDFNVGDASGTDAIFEPVGDAAAAAIVQLHSAEQLLVLTDNGIYSVPETLTNPFTPGNMSFVPFGSPWPLTAGVKAHPFDDGVVMASKSLVIKAAPIGSTRTSWRADEISLLADHLVKTPTEMTTVSNFDNGPERYAVFVNTDGTLALMQLVEDQSVRNFTPWDTSGTYQSTVGIESDLYAAVTRNIGGNTVYWLERFDQDLTLDGVTVFTSLDDISDPYGATTVNVVVDNYHLGTHPLTLDDPPAGPYEVGLDYTAVIELLPPVVNGSEGSQAGEYMRILEALVFVDSSLRFAVEGLSLEAYQVSDDPNDEPPELDGPQRFQFLGWRRHPTLTISQDDPLPLEVQAVKIQVAY